MHVILADDHALVRGGFRRLLAAIPGVLVVGEAGDGAELLALLEDVRPELAIVDVHMPGVDGITALRQCRERHPGVRVLMLSMDHSEATVRRARQAGACGYLSKDCSMQELQDALRAMATAGAYWCPHVQRQAGASRRPPPSRELTRREQDIVRLVARGRSSKQIAIELGLSYRTVEAHRSRIFVRLGVKGIPALTHYAVREGLVEAGAAARCLADGPGDGAGVP